VTGISINQGSQMVSISVTTNLSALLLPAVLNYRKQFTVIGYAKGRLETGGKRKSEKVRFSMA
jgi:hypothetical protein